VDLTLLVENLSLTPTERVKKNSDVMAILGMDCRVLSLQALIRSKKAAGRKRDLEVIPELEGLLDLQKKNQA
jgi:hypothetical protein